MHQMADLHEYLHKLERAEQCLLKGSNIQDTDHALALLEEKIRTGGASVHTFEQYGQLEDRVNKVRELLQKVGFLKDYGRELLLDPVSEQVQQDTIEEIGGCLQDVRTCIFQQKLVEKYDRCNAVVTTRLVMGKSDLYDFLSDLSRSYRRFAGKMGFSCEEIDRDIDEITFRVIGKFSYGYLRGEQGPHRLIYQAHDGRRQTGYLTVMVQPEVENGAEVKLEEKDLNYEFLSSSTKGGQNANKVATGVRITHTPSGLRATSRTRSQVDNLKFALQVLKTRVAAHYREQSEQPSKRITASWGAQIRTYNPCESYINDHRTGVKTKDLTSFFNGNIEPFIEAYHGITFDI